MKEKFYIFLDIDGVLWDVGFIFRNPKTAIHAKRRFIKQFKPESMASLNALIAYLQQRYEVELIVSSSWRKHLQHAEKILLNSGLHYEKPLTCTGKTFLATRGKEISIFLQNKENKNNFVIIDDIPFGLKPHFPAKHIIKTSIFSALSEKQVNNFINNFENNFGNYKQV